MAWKFVMMIGLLFASTQAALAQNNNRADLSDWIQQVVAPRTWQVNGGQGTIRQYQLPNHVLVVRQTQDVHDQMEQVLQQLRRAEQ